jgi:hypothetical protein
MKPPRSDRRSSARALVIGLAFISYFAMGDSTAAGIEDVLVSQGAVWRYLDDGSDAGATWIEPAFDDSGWTSGPARLGYAGRQGQDTIVSFGPDPDSKFATTYFRHSFTVSDPTSYTNLTLRLLRDDSAIVYLNGTETHRANLPTGPITFLDTATYSVKSDEEFEFFQVDIDPTLLTTGLNTIAIEIHRHILSADLAMDLEMIAGDNLRLPYVIRGPYLQGLTSNEVVIRWRTNIQTVGTVRFGAGPGSLTSETNDSTLAIAHEITLSGLTPDTRIFYSVGTESAALAGNDSEHYFDTPPPPGTPKPLRIWVTGDSGTANFRSAAVRDAYLTNVGATETDIWLLLGDNAYGDGTDGQFQVALYNPFAEVLRNTPTWAAIGNHESHSASSINQTGAHFDNFNPPTLGEAGGIPSGTEAYYSFDYANIHFICLDSYGSDRTVGGPMLTWLAADLAETQQEWIIAYWHHPPYSHGSHDSDVDGRMIDMRTNAVPILESGGVDLVLTGHTHDYERSMLMDGHYGFSWELQPSMILDSGDGDPLGDGAYIKPIAAGSPNAGAVYIVAGSSGSTKAGALDHPIMVTSLLELGSVIIEVDGPEMDVRFLNDSGLTLDEFEIRKSAPISPKDVPLFGLLGLGLLSTALLVGSSVWLMQFRPGNHRNQMIGPL